MFQINDVKKVNADLQLQVRINLHVKKVKADLQLQVRINLHVKKVNADLQLQVRIDLHAKKAKIKTSFDSFKNAPDFSLFFNCFPWKNKLKI